LSGFSPGSGAPKTSSSFTAKQLDGFFATFKLSGAQARAKAGKILGVMPFRGVFFFGKKPPTATSRVRIRKEK